MFKKYVILILYYIVTLTLPLSASQSTTITLSECIRYARENNKTLLARKEEINEARMELLNAAGNFLPSITAGGNIIRLDEEPSPFPQALEELMPLAADEPYRTDTMYEINAQVQLPLFTGFRNRSLYRSARKSLEISKENYRKELNNLEHSVTEAFYRALLAEEIKTLNKESEKRLIRYKKQTQTLYENGLASRLDLLRSEVQVSNIRPQIIESKNNLRAARSSLAMLIGKQHRDIIPEGDLKFKRIYHDLEEAVDKALTQRPEMKMLRLQKAAAKEGITIARSAGLPQVFASYNWKTEHPDGTRDAWGDSWNIMLNLSLPIFRGFSTYSETQKAESRKKQLGHTAVQTERGIILEVENAFHELIKEEERISALRKNVEQAKEAFKMAERQYREGLINNLEFMDTELDYMQARISLFSAKADYIISESLLIKATGGE